MIVGHGIDIVDIRRIESMVTRHGDLFVTKVFTGAEIEYCRHMARPALHFSGRWACKEAFYKALLPDQQPLATWKSVEILPDVRRGRPQLNVICEKLALALLNEGIDRIFVSISHEKEFCIASVILARQAG